MAQYYKLLPETTHELQLVQALEGRNWNLVVTLLEQHQFSDQRRHRAIETVLKEAKKKFVERIANSDCSIDNFDTVLTHLLRRCFWDLVSNVLQRGLSDAQFKKAIQNSSSRASGKDFTTYVLSFCSDDKLRLQLACRVKRKMWYAVQTMLKGDVGESQRRLAIEVFNEISETDDFIEHVLGRCGDDVDGVLTILAQWQMWKAASKLLQRGASDQPRRSAVEKCMQLPTYDDFRQYALPYCWKDQRQLDSVLKHLLTRGLWSAAIQLLRQGTTVDCRKWDVEKCRKRATVHDFIQYALPYCSKDQLDSVLENLVERNLWKTAVKVLQQDVSDICRRCAVEEYSQRASGSKFIQYALPYCGENDLDSVLSNLVKRCEWEAAGKLLCQCKPCTTSENGRENVGGKGKTDFYSCILPCHYAYIFPFLEEHKNWDTIVYIIHDFVCETLCAWVKSGKRSPHVDAFWAIVENCRVSETCTFHFFSLMKGDTTSRINKVSERLGLKKELCELLYTSLVHNVCVMICSHSKCPKLLTEPVESCVLDIYTEITSCMQHRSEEESVHDTISDFESTKGYVVKFWELNKSIARPVQLFFRFLEQFHLYHSNRRGDHDDDVLLMMFAVLPLFPELQSVALKIMLRSHNSWNVISHACLSRVWEQDRRHLLQAAVKQRQWSVVKQWADHTLYDDQRVWALDETLREKQWDVALLLADHGLTTTELMRVRYRLAKYADWDTVLHMFERGADVAEVSERLGRMNEDKKMNSSLKLDIRQRYIHALGLERNMQARCQTNLEKACQTRQWAFVLYCLFRNPMKNYVRLALKAAMKTKTWHVVMQLVRLMTDTLQRDSLFSRMMKLRQWGVCRALLEQRLSIKVCLDALPQLMEMNQWTLVARVMEHEVPDDVRQEVMDRAWETREGSVVWLCIKSLQTPLSVEEREALFQRAFSCQLWQVVKPLVEEKDDTGIRHRDTALLEAIEQHQWDLVDHCQLHHADINMKDDDGHAPLQRMAMKKDWEAVEELVVRDGDPDLLDRHGYSVLHRAIESEQWVTVKLLIEYQADIHQRMSPKKSRWYCFTPLIMMINARQGQIIEHTLMWCPDQRKGINDRRETTLHAACLSGCWSSMYYLVARGVNPLAVTYQGNSVLVYALLNKDCPQRMLAECIRLGLGTHQPSLTDLEEERVLSLPDHASSRWNWHVGQKITSPFLCAALRELPVVMKMLYESGACSNRELFLLHKELSDVLEPGTEEQEEMEQQIDHNSLLYSKFTHCVEDVALPYLDEVATTPRRLESACRLVISHCLTLRKTRQSDADQLPLSEKMKNFILFSDLTEPDYGKDTRWSPPTSGT
ncbi:uncharacterized protein [Littorina saxatilis]|uniref:uncharacterized protein n=1 Tax=Littorina saxatilis TaxID=31220 RepID=UPI0038B5D9F3